MKEINEIQQKLSQLFSTYLMDHVSIFFALKDSEIFVDCFYHPIKRMKKEE